MEVMQTKAWMTGGPRAVKESALSRLHRMGWEDVRPALSTTIRGWIMRGFVESCVRGNHALGLEFLGCALEVLEWGRTEWAGVPDDKRGAIFHNAFIRGVRCMRLKVLGVDYRAGLSDRSRDDSLGKLREILAESDAILDDGEVQSLQANVVYEPGSILSFIIYPRGRALAMKGFYYKQMVLSKTLRTAQEVEDHFRNAAKYYLQAAETFSEDDEQHTWYLYAALENLFKAGTPIKATLPIMKRIGLSMDKMKRIWEYSAMAMGCRDKTLERAIRMQRDVVKGMREGRYTMEDKVMPHPPWDYNIAADP
ncbi:hypothetical protein GLOTRDRAFT_114378 [Gloeophyllum trabeum ATCC 11539]|uniref:Uncharacterized protein n=1 Tax=Gloeophyllum trabeum (strain ATCC 11539 / FP-39264 / Madison 617) TaxID=670483 RepID=S7S222_GLOTA|nr:uncharacterized protein GLOTRDRAFT_114378 [Gloeophyllum trabeum ATCC 11539]EPQ59829.1 hypothetical protein GLOTRDRAFT_114378 [Gloeophyllum trabeum ATCC 11539]